MLTAVTPEKMWAITTIDCWYFLLIFIFFAILSFRLNEETERAPNGIKLVVLFVALQGVLVSISITNYNFLGMIEAYFIPMAICALVNLKKN